MAALAPSLDGLRLLIVDDEYMIAMHLESILEDLGCEVVGPAATVVDALAIIETERLDGVLLDANLNGETSAPIATELAMRSIPFVVVTGYGHLKLDSDVLTDAPRVGKPIMRQDLGRIMAATFLPGATAVEP